MVNNADMNLSVFSGYITGFLFILLRTSIFVALLPVIGGRQLPMQFRIGFAVFIAILLTPVVRFQISENDVAMLVLKEVFVGIALGFSVRLIFYAVNMAGLFISYAMGLAMGIVYNPEMGQSTYIAEIYGIMTMMFFLVTNAHHDLIYVFVKSFELLPGGRANMTALVPLVMSMMSKLFVIALKISAPVLVGLLISNILSGFLYKVAPQLNIFFITLPLNIFLGFLLMTVSIPVFEYVLGINFANLRGEMARIIMMAKG
ncbi:MAG: flagellar biosynthetic protein FliR [Deferribacteres bacterium]|nr:flagellar biosynthetic protein FliR [Deferribacteres bacterium]